MCVCVCVCVCVCEGSQTVINWLRFEIPGHYFHVGISTSVCPSVCVYGKGLTTPLPPPVLFKWCIEKLHTQKFGDIPPRRVKKEL